MAAQLGQRRPRLDRGAQGIARHEQLGGEDIGFALDLRLGNLVTQMPMAELVRDQETLRHERLVLGHLGGVADEHVCPN